MFLTLINLLVKYFEAINGNNNSYQYITIDMQSQWKFPYYFIELDSTNTVRKEILISKRYIILNQR